MEKLIQMRRKVYIDPSQVLPGTVLDRRIVADQETAKERVETTIILEDERSLRLSERPMLLSAFLLKAFPCRVKRGCRSL